MTQTPPGSDRERAELAADLKTATLSGSGLGLALLGFAIPLMSIVGVALAYFGWRSARPEYRVGRVFARLSPQLAAHFAHVLALAHRPQEGAAG